MLRRIGVLLLVAGALLAVAVPALARPSNHSVRVLVATAPGASADEVARVHGGRLVHVLRSVGRGFVADVPAATLAALAADPRVVHVERDQVFRATESVPDGVTRIGAASSTTVGGSVDADVAILDTGIDGAHPDLRVVGGVDCRSGSCVAETPTDPHGHGTHVAGTVGARADGVGVVGVAPGVRLWSVKVLDEDGYGLTSSVVAGIDWAASRGDIEVINVSLGCPCSSALLDAAVARATTKGVSVVVAAGNDGKDAAGYSPANHPDAIAVSAISDTDGAPGARGGSDRCGSGEPDDRFVSWSNYGAVVDLAAPGICIASTWPGGRHAYASGTSMAAPHVAGAAARYIAERALAPTSDRAAAVRDGLRREWAVAQSDPCGFTGGRSGEPLLHLTCAPAVTEPAPSESTDTTEPTTEPSPEPTTEPSPEPTPEPTLSFTDIPLSNPHLGSIVTAVTAGLTSGTSSTTYSPERAVTRGQMATFVANLVAATGASLPVDGPSFTDTAGSPHAANIARLAAAGIVSGRGDGSYGPGEPVTRGQMAAFLVRTYAYVTGATLPPAADRFTDDEQSTHEAAIDVAAELGFANGVGDGRFAPDAPVRRDQMATFLVNTLSAML